MEASLSSSHILAFSSSNMCSRSSVSLPSKSTVSFISRSNLFSKSTRQTVRAAAVNDVSAVADPAQAEVTWQIVVGAIAGVTPFVVAGIEFSKRIVAQKRCEVCGGSGLVLREKYYFRCPGCGGFLPWQSWKRFFFWLISLVFNHRRLSPYITPLFFFTDNTSLETEKCGEGDTFTAPCRID